MQTTIHADRLHAGGSIGIAVHQHLYGVTAGADGDQPDLTPQFVDVEKSLQDYDLAAADRTLDRLEASHGPHFTERSWYRLLTLRGHLARLRRQNDTAAGLFLRARAKRPASDQARGLEAFAYHLLGDDAKAHALAEAARSEFPNSAGVLAMWIQTAPESMKFDQIEAVVPAALASDLEVLLALAVKAAWMREAEAGLKYARLAFRLDRVSMDARAVYACAVLVPHLGGPSVAKRTGEVAEEIGAIVPVIESLIEQWRRHGPRATVANAYLQLAAANLLLDRRDEADHAIGEALRLDPGNAEAALQSAHICLHADNTDGAMEQLGPFVAKGYARHTLLLAQLLMSRGNKTDLERARTLLDAGPKEAPDEPADPAGFRRAWTKSQVRACLLQKDFARAATLLDAAEADGGLPPSLMWTLRGMSAEGQGRSDEAKTCALCAAEHPRPDADDSALLAGLLWRVGEPAECLRAMKEFVTEESDDDELRSVARVAAGQGDLEYLLDLERRVRVRGPVPDVLLDRTASLLESISPNRAVEFFKERIDAAGASVEGRYLRVRLSHLGHSLGREDLIERDPAKLPTADEVQPPLCNALVVALRRGGATDAAVRTAYALYRKHPNELDAVQAVVNAFLPPHGPEPELAIPTEVGLDTAVRVAQEPGGEPQWYVLETATPVQRPLQEISPSEPLAMALAGKRTGEVALLEGAFGGTTQYRVLDVLEKHVYRFRRCLEDIGTQFPGQAGMRQFRLQSGDTAEQQLGELLAFVRSEQARDSAGIDAYREQSLLSFYSLSAGQPPLLTLYQLASLEHPLVRCVAGLPDEWDQVVAAIVESSEIAIDPLALATQFLLSDTFGIDVLRNFEAWQTRLLVPELAVHELERLGRGQDGGFDRLWTARSVLNAKIEAGPGFEVDQLVGRLQEFTTFLRERCEIVAGSGCSSIAAEARHALVRGLGRAAAEAVHVAKSRSVPLWTDDLMLGHVARFEGVRRIWTQAFYRAKAGDTEDGRMLYTRVSLALAGVGYEFVALNESQARDAGSRAAWDVRRFPLSAVVTYVGRSDVAKEAGIRIAAGLIVDAWSDRLGGVQASAMTHRLLTSLAGREDGTHALSALNVVTTARFALDVINAARVSTQIFAVRRANLQKSVIQVRRPRVT